MDSIFNLKLKTREVKLLFSMRFVEVLCDLAQKDLSEIFAYIIGKNIEQAQGGVKVNGGLLNSLTVRAAVLAAGVETYRLSIKDGKGADIEEGRDIIAELENPLLNTQWAAIYDALLKCLIADGLPKEKKKEPERKRPLKKSLQSA